MFSRTTPTYDGAGPEHDPLPLRLATAVVVLGLIATGVTVIWRDMAAHGGELVPLAASHAALRQSAAARAAGSPGPGPASADRHPRATRPWPGWRPERVSGCSARRPPPAAGCRTRVFS